VGHFCPPGSGSETLPVRRWILLALLPECNNNNNLEFFFPVLWICIGFNADPDPAFLVNADPDERIWLPKIVKNYKWEKILIFYIKKYNIFIPMPPWWTSNLQEKPSAALIRHFKPWNYSTFSFFFYLFALRDPIWIQRPKSMRIQADPDSYTGYFYDDQHSPWSLSLARRCILFALLPEWDDVGVLTVAKQYWHLLLGSGVNVSLLNIHKVSLRKEKFAAFLDTFITTKRE
jgi:hypothetical protein